MEFNPELKKGDRVQVLHLEEGQFSENLPIGTWGTVISVGPVPYDDVQYMVKWDDGDENNVGKPIQTLGLLKSVDIWTKNEIRRNKRKSIQEANIPPGLLNYFSYEDSNGNKTNFLKFLVEFLLKLQKSSIVNMLQAKPFLYMGRDYINRHYGDGSMSDEEAFEEVLEDADAAKNYMITATMNYLEDKGQLSSYNEDEEDDVILQRVNRTISKMADVVFDVYLTIHKSRRR